MTEQTPRWFWQGGRYDEPSLKHLWSPSGLKGLTPQSLCVGMSLAEDRQVHNTSFLSFLCLQLGVLV